MNTLGKRGSTPSDNGGTKKAKEEERPGHVILLSGDLLTSGKQYIAHQTNCVTHGAAGGLARYLFQKYRYADTYQDRQQPDVPGSIHVFSAEKHKQGVINMYAQWYPGVPDEENDSSRKRQKWFLSCLREISATRGIREVAFPHGIGCGMAGGDWGWYEPTLLRWAAHEAKHIQVYIYYLEPK